MQRVTCFLTAVLIWVIPGWILADVKLPNIFGSHMVLQQGQKNKVWGLAEPGEGVTVAMEGQTHKATADTNGKWQVMLDPVSVGGPYTLTVKGKNEIKFEDVLVGEVWVCSGQSNMQWSVQQCGGSDLAAVKDVPANQQIRLFYVPRKPSAVPVEDVDARCFVEHASQSVRKQARQCRRDGAKPSQQRPALLRCRCDAEPGERGLPRPGPPGPRSPPPERGSARAGNDERQRRHAQRRGPSIPPSRSAPPRRQS